MTGAAFLAAIGLGGIFDRRGAPHRYEPVRRLVDIDDPDVKRWREFYDCIVRQECIYDPLVGVIHSNHCPRRERAPAPR